jgi:hypothetical protein
MSIAAIGFVLIAAVAVLFMGAIMAGQLDIKLPVPHQTGDSSLSARSVKWLGAIALTAAILICLL